MPQATAINPFLSTPAVQPVFGRMEYSGKSHGRSAVEKSNSPSEPTKSKSKTQDQNNTEEFLFAYTRAAQHPRNTSGDVSGDKTLSLTLGREITKGANTKTTIENQERLLEQIDGQLTPFVGAFGAPVVAETAWQDGLLKSEPMLAQTQNALGVHPSTAEALLNFQSVTPQHAGDFRLSGQSIALRSVELSATPELSAGQFGGIAPSQSGQSGANIPATNNAPAGWSNEITPAYDSAIGFVSDGLKTQKLNNGAISGSVAEENAIRANLPDTRRDAVVLQNVIISDSRATLVENVSQAIEQAPHMTPSGLFVQAQAAIPAVRVTAETHSSRGAAKESQQNSPVAEFDTESESTITTDANDNGIANSSSDSSPEKVTKPGERTAVPRPDRSIGVGENSVNGVLPSAEAQIGATKFEFATEATPLGAHSVFQLPDNISELARSHATTIEIALRPESLGQARLSLTYGDAGISGRLVVENEAARQIVEKSLYQLIDRLQRDGVQLNRLDVTVEDQSREQSRRQSGEYDHGAAGHRQQSSNDLFSDEVTEKLARSGATQTSPTISAREDGQMTRRMRPGKIDAFI